MKQSCVGDRVTEAEEVVATALAALKAREWEAVVATTDVASIRELQRTYLENRECLERERLGLEEVPTFLGDEFARNPWEESPPVTYHELFGVTTFAEASSLSSSEFMVRWARAREDFFGPHVMPTSDTRAVVGSIRLDDSKVLVAMLTRQYLRMPSEAKANPLRYTQMIVVLRDEHGRWGIDASADWMGVGGYLCRI